MPKAPAFKPSRVFTVPEDMIVYSFRYALGRRTYAVADVASEVRAHNPTLSNKTRLLIVKEIEEYLTDTDEDGASDIRREWMKTLTVLQGKKLAEAEL